MPEIARFPIGQFPGTFWALEVEISTCYHYTNPNITSDARNFPELPSFRFGRF